MGKLLSGDQTKQNSYLSRLVSYPGTNQYIEKYELKLITILFLITMYIINISTEKSVLSPVAATDVGTRDPDTPTEPAWISIARQKQRGVHQEKELDREKLVAPDNKSNTEKQNKGKEQTEVLAVQICDVFVLPPVVFFGSPAMLPVMP